MDEEQGQSTYGEAFSLDMAPSVANEPLLVANGHSALADDLPTEDKVSELPARHMPYFN